ncbi:MAG: cytochrome c [Candidatus Acidiferrales bacterium]
MQDCRIARGARIQFVILMLMGLILSFAGAAAAQEKEIKKEPIKTSKAASGEEMFKQYCAVCHGKTGKGDGPAASALKEAPADLTTLSQRHDGKFPDGYVANVLRNGAKAPAHGDAEMPVWGPLFSTMDQSDAIVSLRISNLTKYIRSLQAK